MFMLNIILLLVHIVDYRRYLVKAVDPRCSIMTQRFYFFILPGVTFRIFVSSLMYIHVAKCSVQLSLEANILLLFESECSNFPSKCSSCQTPVVLKVQKCLLVQRLLG